MLHANIDEKVDELDDNNKKNVRLCFSSIEMELNGLNKSTNRASKNIRCVRDKLLQFTSRIREYQYFAKSSVCLGSVEPIELRKNMLMISWSESFLYGFCLFVLSCTHFYAFVICFFFSSLLFSWCCFECIHAHLSFRKHMQNDESWTRIPLEFNFAMRKKTMKFWWKKKRRRIEIFRIELINSCCLMFVIIFESTLPIHFKAIAPLFSNIHFFSTF